MVDLHGKDKGNISLLPKLQSWDDGEDKNRPTIINMQRAFYDIRVEDIKNRIKRFEDRNDEVTEEIEAIDEQSSSVDVETAEEIANLYKQVTSQTNHVENLKDQINTVENDRLQALQDHNKEIELFNQNYEEKKIELVSQIKVLNAKINALEDFKKTQTALEEKYKNNCECMETNKEEVKEILRTINTKIEFDKEILKNEMYGHLLDLAAKFQVETNKRITLPNQRLMRENILLKNELAQMLDEISVNKGIEANLKDSAVLFKKNIGEQRSNIKQSIVTIKVQDTVVKRLKKIEKLYTQHPLKIYEPDMDAVDQLRIKEGLINLQFAKLKTMLHREKTRIIITKYCQSKLEYKIKAVVETIYDLKYTISSVRQNSCNVKHFGYTELLLFLEKIINRGQAMFKCAVFKSLETIPQEIIIHTKDLEGIPEDVDISTESDETESEIALVELAIFRKDVEEKLTEASSTSEEDATPFDPILDFLQDWAENDEENEYLFDTNEE